ncbi:MAG: hypothetical protein FJY77_00935 [Candidatus Altiarchaeales archaeon]|nr:hypothetical protein [Candidatus Altiarchaeales archaeon]
MAEPPDEIPLTPTVWDNFAGMPTNEISGFSMVKLNEYPDAKYFVSYDDHGDEVLKKFTGEIPFKDVLFMIVENTVYGQYKDHGLTVRGIKEFMKKFICDLQNPDIAPGLYHFGVYSHPRVIGVLPEVFESQRLVASDPVSSLYMASISGITRKLDALMKEASSVHQRSVGQLERLPVGSIEVLSQLRLPAQSVNEVMLVRVKV